MARSVLVAPAVAQTLTNLNRVAIDIDEQEALAQQRGVRAVPTFQMLSPEGDALASLVGYQAPEPFLEWLTNSLREVKDSLLRQHRSEQRLAAAEQALRQSGARADPEAIRELLALYAEQSSAVRDPAGARLAALAQSQPALLLDGLNHPRLAVRIHVANLLRRRLGEAFNIDPWSDAAARRQAVAQWQQKLSSTAR
jgi:thioredoxin-like negative regulator of GroEL